MLILIYTDSDWSMWKYSILSAPDNYTPSKLMKPNVALPPELRQRYCIKSIKGFSHIKYFFKRVLPTWTFVRWLKRNRVKEGRELFYSFLGTTLFNVQSKGGSSVTKSVSMLRSNTQFKISIPTGDSAFFQ